MRSAIGVDLGGSHLSVGLVSENGEVLFSLREDLPRKSAWAVTRQIGKLIHKLIEISAASPSCIGIGVPGLVNIQQGVVHQSPHFPAWQNVPLQQLLSNQFELPFTLHNDASMFAYGEKCVGGGKNKSDFILLTLGSGIGAGIILQDQLVSGSQGFAGEVGHMTIEQAGPLCSCGNRGCWELYAASQSFQQFASRAVPLQELAELAEQGSEEALSFWKWYGGKLALGVHSLMNVFGVHDFLLSGAVSRAQQFFLAETIKQVRSRSYRYYAEHLSIMPAVLGENGGVIGSALYSLSKTAQT